MHEIVIPGLYLLAGSMAYATLNHLAIALNPPRDLAQILIAALSLIAVPFAIFHAQSLHAANAIEFIWALKYNLATGLLILFIFPWFIAFYSGRVPLLFLAGLSVLFAVLFVINLKQPYSLQFDHFEGIRTLELPWGEKVNRGVGNNGIWAKIAIVGLLIELGYAILTLSNVYRNSRRGADLALLLSVGLFLLTSIEGILARLSVINFIEVGPVGILVMVICVSMVITRETRHRMRTSENQFRALVEQSPFSIQIMSPEGYTHTVNPAWERLWGVKRETLVNYNIRHDSQLVAKGVMPLIEMGFAGKPAEFPPIKYNPADNPEVIGPIRDSWVRAFIYPIKDESGKINDVVLMHEDISERKLTDDALRESELRFRTLIEQSPIGISLSRDGYTDDVNAVFLQMFGYSDIEEVRGQSVINRIAPQCRAEIEDRIRRRLLGEPTEDTYETIGLRKDGSQFPLYVSAKRVELSDGSLSCAFLIDISERKHAEKQITKLTEWQQTLLDSADYSIISTDAEGIIVSFNAAAQRMLGYLPGELIGKHSPAIFHDPDEVAKRAVELSSELCRTVLPGFDVFVAKTIMGHAEEREWTYIRKDGYCFPVRLSVTAMYDSGGKITGYMGIAADLTESKLAKSRLRDSDSRYRTLFENAGDSILLMEGEKFVDCNPATLKMFGCTRDQIIGERPYRFSPDTQPDGRASKDKALEKINAAFKGETSTFEWRHCRYDGMSFDAEVTLNTMEIGGKPHLLATVRDVSERKRVEQLFREVFQTSLDAINITHADGRYHEVNQAFQDITGFDRNEVIGRTGFELNLWADPTQRQRLVEIIHREGEIRNQEIQLIKKSGESMWALISSSKFQLNGEIFLLSITHDITERKQSEKSLKESEIRFRTIIEQSPIGMAFGRDGYHVDANAIYLKMFGYSDIAELRGHLLINQIAPQCRAEVEDRIRSRIEGKQTEAGYETIGLRKDGSQFPLFISAKRIVLSDGPLTYAFLIDMTERNRIATELNNTNILLRELVAKQELSLEEERKSIAREVHDELGQILTSLRFDVSLIRMKFSKGNSDLIKIVQNMSELSDRAIHGVRNVAENLRPAALDIGIVSAIEWLCDNFTARTAVPCEIIIPDGYVKLDNDRLVTVFRIVQESLTNVSRHANASSVKIVLSLNQGDLCLEVSDDGKGFNQSKAGERKSFGLLGMSERALSFGGTLNIVSAEGEGTTVSVRIPVSPEVET
ncbi:MAG: PAS domain S-box protein [Gallionella sp.]|nr:PAS domain S-box protein [Gallionella sp.]